MEARDIMARDVVALSPDMGVDEAAEILIRYRIHGAQVVDADGRLVGIIIEADLLPQEAGPAGLPLTALLGREAPPEVWEHLRRYRGRVVREVMTRDSEHGTVRIRGEVDRASDVELIHTLRGPGGRRRVCCRPVD